MEASVDRNDLARICLDIRRDIIGMIHAGGSGHPGGSLSIVEILAVLYFEVMNIQPDDPGWKKRDRFILSKGHASSVLYATLARRGYFPVEELLTFMSPGTRFQKHIDMHRVPGVEVSSGSLGHGLSVAVGMALADRIDHKERKVFVVMSDGECQTGQVWEAAMAAAHYKLHNLIGFVDSNRLETDGKVADIMAIEPQEDKWHSFGWQVQRINGHDIPQLRAATRSAMQDKTGPNVIICDTVKGKGISYIENNVPWHSHPINDNEYRIGMAELDAAEHELTGVE